MLKLLCYFFCFMFFFGIITAIFGVIIDFITNPIFITVSVVIILLIIIGIIASLKETKKKCTERMNLPLRERLSMNFSDITIGAGINLVEQYLGKNYSVIYENEKEKTCRWEYSDLVDTYKTYSIVIRFEKDESLFGIYRVISKRQTGIWIN